MSFISQSAYYATTGSFFAIAVIAAAARAIIRIYQLKIVHVDDYFFLVATAALVAGAGLFYAFIGKPYTFQAISEGRTIPPPNFVQQSDYVAIHGLIANLLCWTTIFSIKFSFLFHFRTLVNRLYKMEVWWWFTLAVFIPITAIIIPGVFIACPHTGPSFTLYCSSNPGFLRREHGLIYFTVASDIVTDIMLISIPVIVLRKSSFNLSRKLSIAAVLCLSLFMVAIALVRGISAGVVGTENVIWNCFWIQLEASISVIAACPIAFRSLFLVNKSSKENLERHNEGQRSALARLWKRTKPSLQSIRVGATLTGMRTAIRDNGNTQLTSKDDEEYALSSLPEQDFSSSPSLDAPV